MALEQLLTLLLPWEKKMAQPRLNCLVMAEASNFLWSRGNDRRIRWKGGLHSRDKPPENGARGGRVKPQMSDV